MLWVFLNEKNYLMFVEVEERFLNFFKWFSKRTESKIEGNLCPQCDLTSSTFRFTVQLNGNLILFIFLSNMNKRRYGTHLLIFRQSHLHRHSDPSLLIAQFQLFMWALCLPDCLDFTLCSSVLPSSVKGHIFCLKPNDNRAAITCMYIYLLHQNANDKYKGADLFTLLPPSWLTCVSSSSPCSLGGSIRIADAGCPVLALRHRLLRLSSSVGRWLQPASNAAWLGMLVGSWKEDDRLGSLWSYCMS